VQGLSRLSPVRFRITDLFDRRDVGNGALAQGALADRPRHRLHLHPAARAVHPPPRVHPKHGETPQRHVFIPARLGMVIRRPWLSTFRTPPPTPAPPPHLDLQTRPTRSRRPSHLLVHKALVISIRFRILWTCILSPPAGFVLPRTIPYRIRTGCATLSFGPH